MPEEWEHLRACPQFPPPRGQAARVSCHPLPSPRMSSSCIAGRSLASLWACANGLRIRASARRVIRQGDYSAAVRGPSLPWLGSVKALPK